MILSELRIGARSLGSRALCFVSPARCAGSSFTYAKRSAAQTLRKVFYV
ncbi:MAG: hypothetical protein RIR45_435 [Pseudomonadota bacterium]|jgi:hypothetical protein